jgi:hypothetical protein
MFALGHIIYWAGPDDYDRSLNTVKCCPILTLFLFGLLDGYMSGARRLGVILDKIIPVYTFFFISKFIIREYKGYSISYKTKQIKAYFVNKS